MSSSAPSPLALSSDAPPRTTPDGSSQKSTRLSSPHVTTPTGAARSSSEIWIGRIAGFFFTIIELCAIGALLGAIIFPVVGPWGGLRKSPEEMLLLGVRTGAFFSLVWAPGVALVREFIRAARAADQKCDTSGAANAPASKRAE